MEIALTVVGPSTDRSVGAEIAENKHGRAIHDFA